MLTVLAEFPVKATCWVVNWWAPTPGPLYLVDKVLSEHPVIREEIPNCLGKKRFDVFILYRKMYV